LRRLPFLGQPDQLIEYRTAYTCLEPIPDQDIGCGGVAQLGPPGPLIGSALVDAYRMVRTGGDPFIQIGAEGQRAHVTLAFGLNLDRDKRHILYRDPTALGRGDQPEIAFIVAPEHSGEQLDQRNSPDRRTVIEPRAVARDPHVVLFVRPG